MKRLVCLCLLLLLLCACQGTQSSDPSYRIYYPTKNTAFTQAALGFETHSISSDEDLPSALLERLLQDPQNEQLKRILPPDLLVRDYRLHDGVLTVDFSSLYGLLSGIDLTLADYSVTITLLQVPGVETVITTVEGDRITYRDRETLREEDIFFLPDSEREG